MGGFNTGHIWTAKESKSQQQSNHVVSMSAVSPSYCCTHVTNNRSITQWNFTKFSLPGNRKRRRQLIFNFLKVCNSVIKNHFTLINLVLNNFERTHLGRNIFQLQTYFDEVCTLHQHQGLVDMHTKFSLKNFFNLT